MGDLTARTLDEDHDQVRRAHGYHLLRVKEVVQETHDTRSFVLDVPAELADTFGYAAGQFCTFRVRIAGEQHLRSYSMSSAPETDRDLTVTVKRVPGGVVSNWFNDRVAAGDVLELTRPAGVFCVRDGQRPVVAFCGGSGITPVMSIVKSALTTTVRPVRLLYANRDLASVIFDDELRSMGDRHASRLDVRLHLDTDGGFLDAGTVAEFAASAAPGLDGDFYICGPGPFMDLVEATLLGAGVDAGSISIERFDGPGVAASTRARQCHRCRGRRCRGRRCRRAGVGDPDPRRKKGHRRLPAGRHRAPDRAPRRAAGAVLVRGGRLCHLHGHRARGFRHHAGQQRVDARRGGGGMGPDVPGAAPGRNVTVEYERSEPFASRT